MAPRQSGLTLTPVEPSTRMFMSLTLWRTLTAGAIACARSGPEALRLARCPRRRKHAKLDRRRDRSRSIGDAKLAEGPEQVRLDGRLADVERAADLRVGLAARHERQNFGFSR